MLLLIVFTWVAPGDFIRPEGWNNWGKESNEETAYYAEYKSVGKGADPKNRVNWSHQLTDNEYKDYILENVFRGWDPGLK
jgi:pectinesterase